MIFESAVCIAAQLTKKNLPERSANNVHAKQKKFFPQKLAR